MGLQWNGEEAKQQIAEASAKGLLRAAVEFTTEHKKRLNVSNPRPYTNSSKQGEYARARTGFGRDNVAFEPTTVAAIQAEQAVRIGYRRNAFYMGFLEVLRGRKGLLDTMRDLKARLAQLATGGG